MVVAGMNKSLGIRHGYSAVNGARAARSKTAPFLQSLETRVPFAGAGAHMADAQVELIMMAVQVEIVSKVLVTPVSGAKEPLAGPVMDPVQVVPETILGTGIHSRTVSKRAEPAVSNSGGIPNG